MSALLPCPFCGGKAWERGTPSGLSRIECDECQIGQFESCSFSEAQKRWNRRAALSQDTHSLPQSPEAAKPAATNAPPSVAAGTNSTGDA